MEQDKINLYKKLVENKDKYIEECRKEDEQLANDVSILYTKLQERFKVYYQDLLDSGLESANAVNAYKTHKIDPYIAGGVGQAIGGAGVGLYTATSAAKRNQQIDSWRNESLINSSIANAKQEASEEKFLEVLNELDSLLSSRKQVNGQCTEMKTEDIYERGKRLLNGNNYLIAIKDFRSIREYKDSELLLEQAKEGLKKEKRKILRGIGISFIVSIGIAILCARSCYTIMETQNAVSGGLTGIGLFMLLLVGLPATGIGLFSKNIVGVIPGLCIAVGGILMGISSNVSSDRPQGDVTGAISGIMLVGCGFIIICILIISYELKKVKELNLVLSDKQ